ncbi:MAG: sn-glycerol-3-phosphate ABC transporter ATP-binding protein UgpC, partial [Mollicutes bacterium]|nr:sn-glycerol-3-phosphate ABC transporter ATP-binding protein UgpC [Mollicutes bacterium]
MKEKEKKETKVNKEEKEKVSLFKKIFKKDSKKDIINSAKKEAHEKALKEEIIIKNDFQKDIQFDEDAYVSLRHIDKIYDNKVQAVFDFNLDIQKQEFIVLVGPSGCGKSTTLRMIAGLEEISNGELYIDHVLSNDLAPKNRNIAMVFQNYALYPHMTVYDNLAFGLKMTHVPKDEIVERVLNAAKILGLEELLDRKPKALSGGQRQRVALGRAIVRNAKVFLMDEPLSNLDAKLRVQMRAEIIKLHDELKATTIYVTHDQTEAMTMASRIVVMNKGYIQQIGTPIEVYNKPANTFVASFIGAPAMNLLNVTYKDGVITFSDGNTLTLP